METYRKTQGTLLNTLSCPRWEGNPKETGYAYIYSWLILLSSKTSLVAQIVKNLPATQETWVQSLGGEDPLEKGMATHSSILAWRIPGTERSLVGYGPWGHKDLDKTQQITHREANTVPGFPYGSDGTESACNVADLGSVPGLGRSPWEGHGNPLQ